MPPVSAISYGPPPAWCFPLTECCMYVLLVLCTVFAAKKGILHLSYLFAGILFGLLLEYVNVKSNMGYVYGKFFIMLGKSPMEIPFCIGAGWGIIMYTARLFTDQFKMPLWASASLDALLALSIDVSMDAVAYRLHMWTWNWSASGLNPLTAQWFGVPFANFTGWLYVVFFYSSFSRLLERGLLKSNTAIKLKFAIIPLLAVAASQVALWVTMVDIGRFLRRFGITDGLRLLYILIILISVIIYGCKNKKLTKQNMPLITWLVPAWFHIYFFLWLLVGGFYKESYWLLTAGAASMLIGFATHLHFKKRSLKNT